MHSSCPASRRASAWRASSRASAEPTGRGRAWRLPRAMEGNCMDGADNTKRPATVAAGRWVDCRQAPRMPCASGHAGLPGYHWRVSPFTDPAANHDGARCFALVPCAGVGERAGQERAQAVRTHRLRVRWWRTRWRRWPPCHGCRPRWWCWPREMRISRAMRRTFAANGPGLRTAVVPPAPPPWPTDWPNCSAAAPGLATGCWCTTPRAACCGPNGWTG